jgi:hypothetical protein
VKEEEERYEKTEREDRLHVKHGGKKLMKNCSCEGSLKRFQREHEEKIEKRNEPDTYEKRIGIREEITARRAKEAEQAAEAAEARAHREEIIEKKWKEEEAAKRATAEKELQEWENEETAALKARVDKRRRAELAHQAKEKNETDDEGESEEKRRAREEAAMMERKAREQAAAMGAEVKARVKAAADYKRDMERIAREEKRAKERAMAEKQAKERASAAEKKKAAERARVQAQHQEQERLRAKEQRRMEVERARQATAERMEEQQRQVEECAVDELRRFETERRAEAAAAVRFTAAPETLNVWDLLNEEYQAEKNGMEEQSVSMSTDHVPVPKPQDVPIEVVTSGKDAPDNGAKASTPSAYATRDQHADNSAKPSATKVKKTKEKVVAPQAGPSKKVSKAENAVAPQAAPAKKKIAKKEVTRYVAPPEQQAREHLANAAVQAKDANIKATMAPEIGTEQDSAAPQPAPPAKKTNQRPRQQSRKTEIKMPKTPSPQP